MAGRKWAAADESAILHCLRSGMTVAEAADCVDRSPESVKGYMRQHPNFGTEVYRLLRIYGTYAHLGGPRGARAPWTEPEKQCVLEAIRRMGQIAAAVKACGRSISSFDMLRRCDPAFNEAVLAACRDTAAHPSPKPSAIRSATACYVCQKPIKARGLCAMHYFRWRRTGKTGPPESTYGREKCTTPGCGKPHRAKGYCIGCYDRHRNKPD